VSQGNLFPPALEDLVPPGHLSQFIRDLVCDELDLSAIYAHYQELRGYPPYHPAMMTGLLLYGYCRGVFSSRKLEQACEERVDFMALTGMVKPDHSTICQFRCDHRVALSELFVQVLALCREAGMVKLGHVALDGTKVKADASKHSAMSYKRMMEAEPELAKLVEEWMDQAKRTDEQEDREHGPDRRGDEIPAHIKEKMRKLVKVQAAKARLEREAAEKAERLRREREENAEREGRKPGGREPKALEGKPEDKAQSNFTDPESRILKTKDGYEQGYNCQAAVDAEHQVIVAVGVTNKQNDGGELVGLVEQVKDLTGSYPAQVSADAGYCSEANIVALEERRVDPYIATGRQKHGTASPTDEADKKSGPRTQAMREKLKAGGFESPYRLRKQVVEPVFGQIKQARGFRQFLHRGLSKVQGDWSMVCTTHNLLKLYAVRN
jgi:transposase